jgi:hypothetical protein
MNDNLHPHHSSSAWSDGAPLRNLPRPEEARRRSENVEVVNRPAASITERVTRKVSRIRQFEGLRGYSSRVALAVKYVNYFLLVLLCCGLTGYLTKGVRFASGGGTFMLFSVAVITVSGAVATLFYVNLRNELVERIRHYVFGIILIPGTLLAMTLRAFQEWEWANEGSLGGTLRGALPVVFLASVVLPAIVFVKEIIGIRTLHRSKLDDEESVQLWTRQDGLQR